MISTTKSGLIKGFMFNFHHPGEEVGLESLPPLGFQTPGEEVWLEY